MSGAVTTLIMSPILSHSVPPLSLNPYLAKKNIRLLCVFCLFVDYRFSENPAFDFGCYFFRSFLISLFLLFYCCSWNLSLTASSA